MLRACPHHGFSELAQIDTIYNGLNEQDQDSLNAAAGGNLLTVEKSCVIYRGAHTYYDCIATDSNQSSVCAATGTYNQVSPPNRASNQMAPPDFAPVQNNQNRGDFNKQEENLRRNLNNDMRSILGSFFQNQATTLGTLSSNTIPNPKGEMKAVTTRSGLAYEGPLIPTNSSPEKVVERETEETTDKDQSNCQGSTAHIQPSFVPTPIPEPVVPKIQPKPNIPYPSKLNDQKLRRSFLRTGRALIDVYGEEITLRVNDESVTFNLKQTMRYSSTYDDNLVNRIDVVDIACEEYAQDVLDFKYNSKSGNPTLGDILYLEKLLNDDPSQLPLMDLKQAEETKVKSSIEEPSELELKELPSHLEYCKGFKNDEKEAPLKVLKSHKRVIAWKITDIKGIDPRFCIHKILMEEDYKPTVQSQRRVNPKIHEVIKKEVIKLLDAGMSPVHCVPKKGGMTIVVNENNELILTRLVTGWRVCIDYRKLNDATQKGHFPLPFMD
uniref:Reverse transcriptase domain-containing protein n=1 Tax=Tanacetum cinerariifolium TaxID=118510 RepID=A0A6L2LHB8_TANCI|nr:reverse transcriptase domain-containing protein [Tanacetum cinerariifolium]